jgi:hypothetical protein
MQNHPEKTSTIATPQHGENTMSTPQTPITVSMLSEYIGQHSAASYSALALLAEILNGEIDLEQIRLDVLAETQP